MGSWGNQLPASRSDALAIRGDPSASMGVSSRKSGEKVVILDRIWFPNIVSRVVLEDRKIGMYVGPM